MSTRRKLSETRISNKNKLRSLRAKFTFNVIVWFGVDVLRFNANPFSTAMRSRKGFPASRSSFHSVTWTPGRFFSAFPHGCLFAFHADRHTCESKSDFELSFPFNFRTGCSLFRSFLSVSISVSCHVLLHTRFKRKRNDFLSGIFQSFCNLATAILTERRGKFFKCRLKAAPENFKWLWRSEKGWLTIHSNLFPKIENCRCSHAFEDSNYWRKLA